jgi:hypothetical protein
MLGLMEFFDMEGTNTPSQYNDVKYSRAGSAGLIANLSELETLLENHESLGGSYTKEQLLRLKNAAEASSAKGLKVGLAAHTIQRLLANKLKIVTAQVKHSKSVNDIHRSLQQVKGEYSRDIQTHQMFSEYEHAGQKGYYNEMSNGATDLFAYLSQGTRNLISGS